MHKRAVVQESSCSAARFFLSEHQLHQQHIAPVSYTHLIYLSLFESPLPNGPVQKLSDAFARTHSRI